MRALPAGISTATVGVSGSGVWSTQRWLLGTIRVAPLASMKSTSGHMTFTTNSACGRARG